MARQRDPKRDEAFEIWKNSGGTKKLNEIAEELGVSPGTVRGWKNKDAWEEKLNGTFQKKKRSALVNETERSKPKRGAPLGNKNALGNKGGAPPGNKNAVGNKGGAAPLRNANAVKTGEFRSLWYDILDEDEKQLVNQIEVVEPIQQVIDEIKLYSFREAFIMKRIKALKEGMTSAQKRVLKQLKKVKDKVKVDDPNSSEGYRIIEKEDYKLMETEIEEISADPVEQVLAHEEALTRVQDKKVKALDLLFRMTDEFNHKKLMDEIKTTILQEKWDKEKKGNEDDKPIEIIIKRKGDDG